MVQSQAKIDIITEELRVLEDKKNKMIEMRRTLAVERCAREDANPDCFKNPKSKKDMQLALDWMNLGDELLQIESEIKGISSHLVELKKAHTIHLKSALENVKVQRDSAGAKIIAKTNSINSRRPERNTEFIDLSDDVEVSQDIADEQSIISKAAVIQTDVGLVRITAISPDGTSIAGVLDSSLWVKFYSGVLIKAEKNVCVRPKPKEIFSYAGYKDKYQKCYQITTIKEYTLTAVSGTGSNMDVVTLKKNMESMKGLNWVISSNDTSAAVDNTDYLYGDPVMPAKSARKRKYVTYKYVPVPDDK